MKEFLFFIISSIIGVTALAATGDSAFKYYGEVGQRYKEVKMLHIGLNGWWHPLDIWFVITGRV